MNKKLIVFDMDGTLTESKVKMDEEMAQLICPLLKRVKLGVISGASYQQFEKQFLELLGCPGKLLKRLYLLPVNGSSLYEYREESFKAVYKDELSPEEKQKIHEALGEVLRRVGFETQNIHGELLEDRGGQITFSGLGQTAPLEEKKAWDRDHKKREKIVEELEKELEGFEIKIAGTTSIDITRSGVDKAEGIKRLAEYIDIPLSQVSFVGDALYQGGNDKSVERLGIECKEVKGPEETKRIIREIIER